MSESRFVGWLDLIFVFVLLAFVIFFVAFSLKSQVTDLQRRVGNLEQQK